MAAILAAAWPALAGDEEIIALYEQSGRAWDEGRYEDADRAGEAAWRQAEIEWGASEDTASLADALSRMRLSLGNPQAAQAPAARVVELAEAGVAPSISAPEARVVHARALLEAPPQEQTLARLEQALLGAETAGSGDAQIWAGWLDIGRARWTAGRWDQAYEAASRAMTHMERTGGADAGMVEAAIIAGGSAARTRRHDDAARAFARASASTNTVRERNGIREIDPSWATLEAWTMASAVAYSTIHQSLATAAPASMPALPGQRARGGGANCWPDWTAQPGAVYPAGAFGRTNSRLRSDVMPVGAVVVAYRFDEDGATTDVYSAAAIPDGFGPFIDASVNAVKKWRADPQSVRDCIGQPQHVTMTYGVNYY